MHGLFAMRLSHRSSLAACKFVRCLSWANVYDRRTTHERAPRLGAVATRNAAASELFPRWPGDGNNVPFVGPDHLMGYSRSGHRSFLGVACRMDLRNSP